MNYEKGFVLHAGDVTAICVGEQEFLGRVIDPDLEMVKAPVVLMYQFDADASQVDLGDDRSCLQASRRLGSYVLVNKKEFRRKWFRRVASLDFEPGERLAVHHFRMENRVVDEHGHLLDSPVEPLPRYEMLSSWGLALQVADAQGWLLVDPGSGGAAGASRIVTIHRGELKLDLNRAAAVLGPALEGMGIVPDAAWWASMVSWLEPTRRRHLEFHVDATHLVATGPGPDLRAVAEGMVELVAHPVSAREALRAALEAGIDVTDPATDSPSLQ